jgi:sigma-B regulation protein RsbU (phosphoserine phosphatase)
MYDFLHYDNHRTGIALGDASGKAAPAALYAALVSGIMRAAAPRALHPEEMLRLLNDSLQERRVDAQYVTMVYAVWNDEDQTLEIANAGAVQPLISRSGEVETIHAEGFPLGLFPNVSYEQFTLSLRPGDSVVFFSDGLADAQNPEGEMFGTEQLCEIVQQNAFLGANELADLVMDKISEFQAGAEHFDDETLIVLRVHDAPSGSPAS